MRPLGGPVGMLDALDFEEQPVAVEGSAPSS